MCAAHIFELSSVDETVWGDLGQTTPVRREQPALGRHPRVLCHLQVLQNWCSKDNRSLGQGSGVYVLPECAASADNAGLAPKILLVL